MLVLTRDDFEEVILTVEPSTKPTVIRVVLVETRQNKARIGFDAERHVSIARKEILERANAD